MGQRACEYLNVCLSVWVSVPMCVCVCVCVCLSVSVSAFVCACLSLCLPLCLPVSLSKKCFIVPNVEVQDAVVRAGVMVTLDAFDWVPLPCKREVVCNFIP